MTAQTIEQLRRLQDDRSGDPVLQKLEILEINIEVLLDAFRLDTGRQFESIAIVQIEGVDYVEIGLKPEAA